MTDNQTLFRAALLDGTLPRPAGLTDGQRRPAGRRFDVYRNNVAVGLCDALEQAFPVVRKLVGDAFFRAMAGLHVRSHPPKTPLMMFYGTDFPAFLATFPPVSHLPYLADVARLELALRDSYHAVDTVPVDPARLAALSPEALDSARLRLAPALRLIGSDWPVAAIWRANTDPAAPPPAPGPQAALVLRPLLDPVVVALPPAQGSAIAALLDGATLGQALDETTAGPVLALLVTHHAITDILT